MELRNFVPTWSHIHCIIIYQGTASADGTRWFVTVAVVDLVHLEPTEQQRDDCIKHTPKTSLIRYIASYISSCVVLQINMQSLKMVDTC